MKYQVTKHYLKTKEALIASFFDLNDAKIFIAEKLKCDDINRTNILYRLYDDNELIQEFNHENLSLIDAEDAETFSNHQLPYQVKIQAINALDRISVAYFNDEDDANLFVAAKCYRDDKSHACDTFLIFKNQILSTTLNKNILDNQALKDRLSSGNGHGATLSPLSTRPTPAGGPPDYWIDKNDDHE